MLTDLGVRVAVALAGLAAALAVGQSVYRGLSAEGRPGRETAPCQLIVGRDGAYWYECADAG